MSKIIIHLLLIELIGWLSF